MTRRFGVLVAALGFSLTLACGGGDTQSSGSAPAKTDSKALTVATGDFGVPECDDYMKKYVACIDSKVPDAARAAFKMGLEQTKDAWKKAAATPQGRAGLVNVCTQALSTAKASLGAYGCQW